jgi:hypothetical protein
MTSSSSEPGDAASPMLIEAAPMHRLTDATAGEQGAAIRAGTATRGESVDQPPAPAR